MEYISLDTSEIDRWIGNPIGGEQLKEAVTVTDVRRWTQAMHNPNPLYFDDGFARDSYFGKLVPPQSFIIACAIRHGTTTSVQGKIPGAQFMNAGDEWWFAGRVSLGDVVTSARHALDYRIATTKLAGPTVFQRGETIYLNQDGHELARQRSTSMRYLPANMSKERPASAKGSEPPNWSPEQIEEFETERLYYARGLHERRSPTVVRTQVGDALQRRLIGPHSIQSFTTEQRAFLYTVWGNLYFDDLPRTEREFRAAEAAIDPAFGDGLYYGISAGHTDSKAAGLRGMPRAYGTGGAMFAYVVDYAANWAGERGAILHCNLPYRSPVLVGDVTIISGTVANVERDTKPGFGTATINIELADQDGEILTRGHATVQLPMK